MKKILKQTPSGGISFFDYYLTKLYVPEKLQLRKNLLYRRAALTPI